MADLFGSGRVAGRGDAERGDDGAAAARPVAPGAAAPRRSALGRRLLSQRPAGLCKRPEVAGGSSIAPAHGARAAIHATRL